MVVETIQYALALFYNSHFPTRLLSQASESLLIQTMNVSANLLPLEEHRERHHLSEWSRHFIHVKSQLKP